MFLGKKTGSTKTVFKIDLQFSEGMLFLWGPQYTFHCIRKEAFEFPLHILKVEYGGTIKDAITL